MNKNILIGSIFVVLLTTNSAMAGSDNSGGSKAAHGHSTMQMNNQSPVEINTQPFVNKKDGTEAWHGHSSVETQKMSMMKNPNHHETSVADYYSIDFMSDK